MNRRIFFAVAAAVALGLVCERPIAAAEPKPGAVRPNVLFVLADDKY